MAKALDSAELRVSANVILRDNRGRILGKIKDGVEEAFREMAEDGVTFAMAHQPPPGKKPDPRSAPIGASFYSGWDDKSAWWGNNARHALAAELGTRRHPQTGRVSFYWEREGRWWKSGPNEIDHPPTGAKPFLRPSYFAIVENYKDYLRRHLS